MFKTTALLAAVACVSSVAAYATAPNYCPQSELDKFAPLLVTNGNDILACQTASGWTLIPPTGEPTITQEIKMCKNANCKNLLAAVKAKNPSDCFLSLTNSPTSGVNVKKLVDEFEPFCKLYGGWTV